MLIKSLRRILFASTLIAASAICSAQAPWWENGGPGTFSTSSWTQDRYVPAGWQGGATDPLGGEALKVTISNDDRRNLRSAGFNNSFYDTQGRSRLAVKSFEVGGELFIPNDWGTAGNLRQAGLWTRDNSADEGSAYYPILSFINNDPSDPYNPNALAFAPRFRVWDSNFGWRNLATPVLYGQYNSFKIVDTGSSHQCYINGALAYTLSDDSYSLPGNEGFKQIILQATNFGNETNTASLPDSGYEVFWRNVYAIDPPVAVDDNFTVDAGTATKATLDVLANDYSANHHTITLDGFTLPSHGSLSLSSGMLKYSVTGTYVGPDTFQYGIVDSNGLTATATVHITTQYSKIASVTVPSANFRGGLDTVGTVTLTNAPAQDTYVVTLVSNNPAVVVPPSITITSGLTGTFPITTSNVLADTPVNITATLHGKSKSKAINLKPIRLTSVVTGIATVLGGVNDSFVTVTLEAAPNVTAVTVDLSSSIPGAAAIQPTVVFAIGETSKNVPVISLPVAAITSATITGTCIVPKTAKVKVNPVKITTLGVSAPALNPGQFGIATVTLNGTLKPGISVTVAIASPGGLLNIPPTLVITGSNAGTFPYSAPAVSLGFTAIVSLDTTLAGYTKSKNITIRR